MPIPTRPSTGAPIESTWGQELHDAAFAPAGGRWHSQSASIAVGPTVDIPLVADNDPGSWLAAAGSQSLIVPMDGAGLYSLVGHAVTAVVDQTFWRWLVNLNGTTVAGFAGSLVGTSAIGLNLGWTLTVPLVPGDALTFRFINPSGAGRLNISAITATRVGAAWGLP